MSLVSLLRPCVRALAPGLTVAALATACGPVAEGARPVEMPALAKKWFERAQASYRSTDIEDAQSAIENALRVAPEHPEVRLLAAEIALAQLEFARAVQVLEGVEGTRAGGVRGRALWYSGQIEKAADELEQLLEDPEVRDPWAKEVSKLARRGSGRRPFELSGGLLAVMEMPMVASTWMIVPLEINGEPALGAIATGTPETLIDSSGGGAEASWVSLRFGDRVEVRDVPALPKDLSGISRQLDAPIKVLLGVNLLRHLHPTLDFGGGQFVVRTFDPPPPPAATTVRLSYIRGGGMALQCGFGAADSAPTGALLIDTSMTFPLALDAGGWKKAGVPESRLKPVPSAGKLKSGTLPMLRLGAFEIPKVPGVLGAPIEQLEEEIGVDLDGLLGSGMLAAFRVTLVDRGRTMWLEDLPSESLSGDPRRPPPPEEPGDAEPAPAPEPRPAASGAPAPAASGAPAPATSGAPAPATSGAPPP